MAFIIITIVTTNKAISVYDVLIIVLFYFSIPPSFHKTSVHYRCSGFRNCVQDCRLSNCFQAKVILCADY